MDTDLGGDGVISSTFQRLSVSSILPRGDRDRDLDEEPPYSSGREREGAWFRAKAKEVTRGGERLSDGRPSYSCANGVKSPCPLGGVPLPEGVSREEDGEATRIGEERSASEEARIVEDDSAVGMSRLL